MRPGGQPQCGGLGSSHGSSLVRLPPKSPDHPGGYAEQMEEVPGAHGVAGSRRYEGPPHASLQDAVPRGPLAGSVGG